MMRNIIHRASIILSPVVTASARVFSLCPRLLASPTKVGLPVLCHAVSEIQIDQTLVRDPRFVRHALEIADDIIAHANCHRLLELGCVRVAKDLISDCAYAPKIDPCLPRSCSAPRWAHRRRCGRCDAAARRGSPAEFLHPPTDQCSFVAIIEQ